MRRENINSRIIRESITEALLILMQTTPFEKINITDLVKKAGVSRVSFYRNYESKEAVLTGIMHEVTMSWWETAGRYEGARRVAEVFAYCYANRQFLLLLYRQDLSHLLYEALTVLLAGEETEAAGPAGRQSAYAHALLVGCVYGVLNEWISCGMEEKPEELQAYLSAAGYRALFEQL